MLLFTENKYVEYKPVVYVILNNEVTPLAVEVK